MNFELVQFFKESASLAGFPVPLIVFSGSGAAVQYASTMDTFKDKSIMMVDFGQINTCMTHVKFNSTNRKNTINVSGNVCTPLYSGKYLNTVSTELIIKHAAKKGSISSNEKLSIAYSATVLKEKLTSNENYMMAVLYTF